MGVSREVSVREALASFRRELDHDPEEWTPALTRRLRGWFADHRLDDPALAAAVVALLRSGLLSTPGAPSWAKPPDAFAVGRLATSLYRAEAVAEDLAAEAVRVWFGIRDGSSAETPSGGPGGKALGAHQTGRPRRFWLAAVLTAATATVLVYDSTTRLVDAPATPTPESESEEPEQQEPEPTPPPTAQATADPEAASQALRQELPRLTRSEPPAAPEGTRLEDSPSRPPPDEGSPVQPGQQTSLGADSAESAPIRSQGTQSASPPQAPDVQPAQPTEPIRVSGAVTEPVRIRYVEPNYPPVARRIRVQGSVVLRATIDKNGVVTDVEVLKGPSRGLTEAAVAAVKQWKYKPATLNGKPVAVYFNLTVHFRLF